MPNKPFVNSQLLSPFKMGDLTLSNRVVMAPMTRARAGLSRIPNDIMVQYYAQRASAGLIITEAVAISEQGYGWYCTPGCYTHEQAEGWKKVVDAVHAKGGKIFLQLWHMGWQSHPSFHTETNTEVVFAVDGKINAAGATTRHAVTHESIPFEAARALRTDEIAGVVLQYKTSAEFAKQAGFDGVDILAGGSYLLDGFFQSCVNTRTDQYGGSFENRYRILGEIVAAISEVFPSNRIGLKISPNGSYGGMGSADNDLFFRYMATQLQPLGLAYLMIMDGMFREGPLKEHDKCRHLTLYDMKECFKGTVMGNINYNRDSAEGAIHSGAADLIAFGRPFIPNPDLVERFANGWPLAEDPPYPYFHSTELGAVGYCDFPVYEQQVETEECETNAKK